MSYSGFLVKVGDYAIPEKIIRPESYKAGPNTLDLDSYRDANGILHREALEHVPFKVEFETIAMLTNKTYPELMANISRNFINAREQKFIGTVYVCALDDYITQNMYMPDTLPTIYNISDGVIRYNPVRIAFIGY